MADGPSLTDVAALALEPDFYERPATEVAPDLVGKLLVRDDGCDHVTARAGRIVEVEAYSSDGDPAAHSRNGPTARNATMFGPPGRLYVYLIYGLHWCANAVCAPAGTGDAVLLRAVEPVQGSEIMTACRSSAGRPVAFTELCSGPAKLTQAFGIDGSHDGCDLTSNGGLSICDDGWSPACLARSPRIGISRGTDLPWRWYIPASPHASAP
ncbi:DNA-3-methyladenine glycosylase [Candidatus Poriferisodalis sp.]|uniref:DNA-3-methyladenine glycosylase n=1 Tax=Candidatus Poriferisodalis sp. TaxID=3101277 RepID=UPI003B02BBFD